MVTEKKKKYNHFTEKERYKLEALHEKKHKIKDISEIFKGCELNIKLLILCVIKKLFL